MDQWITQPRHDYNSHPDINVTNKICADEIIKYLPYVENWVVCCEAAEVITPEFDYLPRFTHGNDLVLYMQQSGLKRIVYVGFHWGRCILGRQDGAKKMSKTYKCYAKQNLCGAYLDDDQDLMTEYSKPYLTCF